MILLTTKNNRPLLLFGIFLLGFSLKVAISQLGSNFDFEMWKLNLAFFQKGESFYNYGRYNYSPFWIYLLNIIDQINISYFENSNIFRYKIIFILNLFDFLIFYLICVVIFSSGIFNHYFAIPLLALAVLWNIKYFYYTLACISLYLLDGEALGLGLKIFSNFFEWDIRSTRILYHPIILLPFLGLLDSVVGRKAMNFYYKSIYNFLLLILNNKYN